MFTFIIKYIIMNYGKWSRVSLKGFCVTLIINSWLLPSKEEINYELYKI